jgi:hypothetical protein
LRFKDREVLPLQEIPRREKGGKMKLSPFDLSQKIKHIISKTCDCEVMWHVMEITVEQYDTIIAETSALLMKERERTIRESFKHRCDVCCEAFETSEERNHHEVVHGRILCDEN